MILSRVALRQCDIGGLTEHRDYPANSLEMGGHSSLKIINATIILCRDGYKLEATSKRLKS